MRAQPIATRLAAVSLIAAMWALPALAANECELYYRYSTSSGATGTTVHLDQGESQAISKSQILYIENKKNHPVNVEITNLWPPYGKKWVTLNGSGDRDPSSGSYGSSVTLYNAECGGQSFVSPEQLVSTLKEAGVDVEEIAAQLISTFNQSGQQVAQLLKDAGFTATQMATGLKDGFNATGQEVASWMSQSGVWARHAAAGLKNAFNASGEEVATWLKQANYSAAQVTQGLIDSFNASAGQAAEWLHQAGFSISQIAQALQDKFNTTAEGFIAALQFDVCGVAGCPGDRFRQLVEVLQNRYNQSMAQAFDLLMDAGYSITAIVEALKDVYNASGQQIAQLLQDANVSALQALQALNDVFNAGAQQATSWMRQAGFAAGQIAAALQEVYNASMEQIAQYFDQAGFTMNEVVLALKDGLNATASDLVALLRALYDATNDAIEGALTSAGFAGRAVTVALVGTINLENVINGFTGGYHGIPIATPDQQFPIPPGTTSITLRGQGLLAVTSINGVPGTATIKSRGTGQAGNAVWDYLHVEIDAGSAREGNGGTGRLYVGNALGPVFNWVVQAAAPSRRVGARPAQPPSRGGGGGGRAPLPDLQPIPFVGTAYVVGSATTTDANGDIFTALEPFNGSPFCQGIPQGSVDRRSNQPTSNTAQITVPDLRWGVENTSTVDVTDAFTIKLFLGRQEVARQNINGLRAGESGEFSYQRPQSQTTVARVGMGNGCYHAGLATEGWNDNGGFRVEVDTGRSVSESNEGNNARAL